MTKPISITVKYRLGHSYEECWRSSELFCPACGSKAVWEELGEGDYYVGPGLLCSACGSNWTMQGPYDGDDRYGGETCNKQRHEAILAHLSKESGQ